MNIIKDGWGAPFRLVYFRKKLFHLVPVFFLVTFASFMLVDLLPGDIVDAILSDGDAAASSDPKLRAALEKEMGLDRPLVVRYVVWLGNMVQGDFGRSYINGKEIGELLADRFPVTLQLMIMSLTFGLIIAVPLGILSAFKANKPIDQLISAGAFGILATPAFVTAIMAVYLFAVILHWLPAAGYSSMEDGIGDNLKSFILPTLAVGLAEVPIFLRVLRVDMISTLQEDYISLAKAKGMSVSYILFHHALRPSSFTLITVVGLQVGRLISGLVIIEQIFALPGIGKLLIDAIDQRDLFVVQGVVTFAAIAYVLINLTVDALYAVLDPRVNRRSTEAAL